jgi:hypothetical protein
MARWLLQVRDDLPVIIMPNAAHHLDLKAPNPADPADVVAARAQEEAILAGWLDQFAAAAANSTHTKRLPSLRSTHK